MPLNPEEVVNKRFSATKFRQGYDEEEVDEFLDEVVTELRRLNAENADLRSKLTTCEGRVAELSSQAGDRSSGTVGSPVDGPSPVGATAPAPEATPQPEATPEPTPESTPQPVASAPAASASPVAAGPDSVTGMLALAQKLHDEHVADGRAQGQQILTDAREQAARLVTEAETTSRETLGNLQHQRQELEGQVEELRGFEREYRSRLKSYLEGQLHELEQSGSASGASSVTGDGMSSRTSLGG